MKKATHPRRTLIIAVFVISAIAALVAILVLVFNKPKKASTPPAEGWGYNDGVQTPGQTPTPFNPDLVLYQGVIAAKEVKALQRLLNTKKDNYQGGGIFNYVSDAIIMSAPRLQENGVFDQKTAEMLHLFTNKWDGTLREIAPLLGMNVPTS